MKRFTNETKRVRIVWAPKAKRQLIGRVGSVLISTIDRGAWVELDGDPLPMDLRTYAHDEYVVKVYAFEVEAA